MLGTEPAGARTNPRPFPLTVQIPPQWLEHLSTQFVTNPLPVPRLLLRKQTHLTLRKIPPLLLLALR